MEIIFTATPFWVTMLCPAMAFVVTWPLQECKAAQKDTSHSAIVTLAFVYTI